MAKRQRGEGARSEMISLGPYRRSFIFLPSSPTHSPQPPYLPPGLWPALAMSASVYLPAEVVVNIVEFVFGEDTTFLPDQKEKQRDLRSCCLVSRQWYSASIGFLYHRPCFLKGNSFVQFTNTVCPPVGTRRKRNVDLGSLVHCLDLGGLVHHSSNSLTARLLGRVKKNLEYFVAPRVSFA